MGQVKRGFQVKKWVRSKVGFRSKVGLYQKVDLRSKVGLVKVMAFHSIHRYCYSAGDSRTPRVSSYICNHVTVYEILCVISYEI